jgi:hypothetical protein
MYRGTACCKTTRTQSEYFVSYCWIPKTSHVNVLDHAQIIQQTIIV